MFPGLVSSGSVSATRTCVYFAFPSQMSTLCSFCLTFFVLIQKYIGGLEKSVIFLHVGHFQHTFVTMYLCCIRASTFASGWRFHTDSAYLPANLCSNPSTLLVSCVNSPIDSNVLHHLPGACCEVLCVLSERGLTVGLVLAAEVLAHSGKLENSLIYVGVHQRNLTEFLVFPPACQDPCICSGQVPVQVQVNVQSLAMMRCTDLATTTPSQLVTLLSLLCLGIV